MNLFSFFTDPLLRAPTLGCILMSLASSLVGVLVFLKKRSLLGEALSHAAYPGVVGALFISFLCFPSSEEGAALFLLGGGFITSLLGLKTIDYLERNGRVKDDAALCFVLSTFFGVGVLMASRMQLITPLFYKKAQLFLYGQAATMQDIHILLYGALLSVILFFIIFFFRHLESVTFDPPFSGSLGIAHKRIDHLTFFLLALSIMVGIRSVGVVLMAGMLIAPAAAARPLSRKFSHLFWIAGCVGVFSGFLGNYLSFVLSQGKYSLPTGPLILLSASSLSFISLLFAPQKGILSRLIRLSVFKNRCNLENVLKILWKRGGHLPFLPWWVAWQLRAKKWVERTETGYKLSPTGLKQAEKIVRLHRLWEVYLVDYMGQQAEKVHKSAEELEHLMTPEVEKTLTELLKNPQVDPHAQPIPPFEAQL